MDEKTIHGEIARKCGKNNALFSYRINTDTNEIEYCVDSLIDCKYEKRAFEKYADAKAYFDWLHAVSKLDAVDAPGRN